MKYANLLSPSGKLCLAMALATGMTLFPMPTMASEAIQATQQSGVVKGLVVDKNGEAIIGATVRVKERSNAGTVTDIAGNFELRNIPASGTLVVS